MKTFGVTALYTKEIRCKKCKRLLMKGEVQAIEIKCPKCGYVQTIDSKGGEREAKSEERCDMAQ